VATDPPSLRVLFATPAYWPALSFGGPIWIAKELAEGLASNGHPVDVLTTTLLDIEAGRSVRGRVELLGGARVHYLATPVRYRWFGLTPTLPLELTRLPKPDVAHVFGCRDPVGIAVAAWCRLRRIPYVLEPLGMFRPRVRKLRLKRALDPLLSRPGARGASLIVAASELELEDLADLGVPQERIAVRPYPFPPPRPGRTGKLRRQLGLADDDPLVLYVGRIAAGKGIDLLLRAVRDLPGVHVALVGPRDHKDVAALADAASAANGRVHVLPPSTDERPLALYGDADVFVLPAESERENFGLVVAEAVAAGVPTVISERAGIAGLLGDSAALVVRPEPAAIREGIDRVLRQKDLRERLRQGGFEVAAANSTAAIVKRQEELYRRTLAS